jgi:hypothetical protein
MIPWQSIDIALGGHAAKFVSLGLLHPVNKGGLLYVDETEWEAFQARIGGARPASRAKDWMPEGGGGGGSAILGALRHLGARIRKR